MASLAIGLGDVKPGYTDGVPLACASSSLSFSSLPLLCSFQQGFVFVILERGSQSFLKFFGTHICGRAAVALEVIVHQSERFDWHFVCGEVAVERNDLPGSISFGIAILDQHLVSVQDNFNARGRLLFSTITFGPDCDPWSRECGSK